MVVVDPGGEKPLLSISSEKVFRIASKARQFDVKDVVTEPDPGSNAADDGMISILENHADDPAAAELTTAIRGLNEDEQVDLVALAWLGRGDGELTNWSEIRGEAARARNDRTAEYLMSMPLLADYLDEAMADFGYSPDEESL